MRTKPNILSNQLLVSGALGIAGEYSEVLLDIRDGRDILLECGDIIWYCAVTCDSINMSLGEIFPTENDVCLFVPSINIGAIAEIAKKAFLHGLTIKIKQKVILLDAVHDLLKWVREQLSTFGGYTLEECMLANINKLNGVYPNGFVKKEK